MQESVYLTENFVLWSVKDKFLYTILCVELPTHVRTLIGKKVFLALC